MADKLTILRDLKGYLQKKYNHSVKDLILFGSQLDDNSNDNSDYDILIILDKNYNARDENQIYDLCYDINLKYNIIIDAHLISQRELNSLRGKQPIYTKAIKTGLYA
jgi:predicted nucleotidyltransferase